MSRILDGRPLLGLVEWVTFPELGVHEPYEVKVDSGAKRTCIGAWDMESVMLHGRQHVSFKTRPMRASEIAANAYDDSLPAYELVLPVKKKLVVNSSNGQGSERFVVESSALVGGVRTVQMPMAEITLRDRRDMAYWVLFGRESMGHALISPQEDYLQGGAINPRRGTKMGDNN